MPQHSTSTDLRPTLSSVRQDLRYALRGFRREPGFTAIAVAILALGIGANTAVFSLVNPLLLRPLPFPNADSLVWIAPDVDALGLSGRTYPTGVFEELRRHNTSFEDLTAYFAFFGFDSFTLTGRGEAERFVGVRVAPRFFEVLGVQPEAGRFFTPEELVPNGPRAVILTHGVWQRRFAADPSIVGQAVTINDEPVTIAGVLPADFDFASVFVPGTRVDLFVPAVLETMRPWGNTMAVIGRLKQGVSVQAARSEFVELLPRLNRLHPDWGPRTARLTELKTHVSGRMQRSLVVLWGAVGLVLLIVCANLSNLLLARTAARSKEIAVRLALGAGRARIVRQLVTEGIVLSMTGAAVGIPLAYALTAYVKTSVTLSVPLLHRVEVDGTALIFTAAIAILAGVTFGALPALRISGRNPHDALREQGRGSTDSRRHAWIRSALVVSEVALACVLLVGAGLLLRSFLRLQEVELGFQPSRAIAVRVDPNAQLAPDKRRALLGELTRRVAALPGVEAAGLTDALPLDRNRTWNIGVPGVVYSASVRRPIAFVYVTGPGYMKAMGIPIKAGRDFLDQDTATSAPVMIVNESLARRLWPDADPVGRFAVTGNNPPLKVVGVVADVRQTSLEEHAEFQMYFVYTQSGASADLIVRSQLPPATLAATVRATLGALDPTLVTTDVRPLEQLVDRAVSPRRFLLTLLGGFSLLALTLACLGIYGVVSYTVSRRVQEMGVRMALGATAGDVCRLVLTGTLKVALAGVVLGSLASLGVARLIATFLFGTSSTDPLTFASTAVLLTMVAMVAGYIPARRASRVEPMSALRAD
jgi:predicted permease